MKINQLLVKYINEKDKGQHTRKIGRYYASEIYSISEGYLKPEDFFKERGIDKYGCENIAGGCAYESYLQGVLSWGGAKCEYQAKKEIKINDEITLVVKPDFLFSNMLWETKYADAPMKDEIPDKWKFQLECEARAFNMLDGTYLGIFRRHPFLTLVKFKPSTLRWNNIQKILTKFHEELKKYEGERIQKAVEK